MATSSGTSGASYNLYFNPLQTESEKQKGYIPTDPLYLIWLKHAENNNRRFPS